MIKELFENNREQLERDHEEDLDNEECETIYRQVIKEMKEDKTGFKILRPDFLEAS